MANIELYTTAICPYCVAAKNLLKSRGLSWQEIRIDNDPDKRDEMLKRSQRRTVPQIFIDDRLIGGYDDLVEFDRKGGLAALLASSPSHS